MKHGNERNYYTTLIKKHVGFHPFFFFSYNPYKLEKRGTKTYSLLGYKND
jgi:hypothetical protein